MLARYPPAPTSANRTGCPSQLSRAGRAQDGNRPLCRRATEGALERTGDANEPRPHAWAHVDERVGHRQPDVVAGCGQEPCLVDGEERVVRRRQELDRGDDAPDPGEWGELGDERPRVRLQRREELAEPPGIAVREERGNGRVAGRGRRHRAGRGASDERRGGIRAALVVTGRPEAQDPLQAGERRDREHRLHPSREPGIARGEDGEARSRRRPDQGDRRSEGAGDLDQRVHGARCHLARANVRKLGRDGDEARRASPPSIFPTAGSSIPRAVAAFAKTTTGPPSPREGRATSASMPAMRVRAHGLLLPPAVAESTTRLRITRPPRARPWLGATGTSRSGGARPGSRFTFPRGTPAAAGTQQVAVAASPSGGRSGRSSRRVRARGRSAAGRRPQPPHALRRVLDVEVEDDAGPGLARPGEGGLVVALDQADGAVHDVRLESA